MPGLNGMFKKTSYIRLFNEKEDASEEVKLRPEVPEGMWTKCGKCSSALYSEELHDLYHICPKCGQNLRVGARERIEMIIDEGTFTEWNQEMETINPLDFPGYEQKLELLRSQTGLSEAVITGCGCIHSEKTVIAVMDAAFFMGSMGHTVGEKITRAIEQATIQQQPMIIYCCSGGARMQEGMISLMQMAKTSAALKRHSDAGLPYFSILTDPTTGGVTASFAMLGDVILAEPGALIGFAGPRVIEQTIGQKLPKGFQRAEFLLEHGFVDAIVKRPEQKDILARLIRLHRYEKNAGGEHNECNSMG